MFVALLATILALPAAADTLPATARGEARVDSASLASAFADPRARVLLEHARAQRDSSNRAILSYRALARTRISIGLSTLRRERLLYRRELAARVHWRRHGPLAVDLLGAREVIPPIFSDARVPGGLGRATPRFIFDPMDSQFLLGSEPGKDDPNLYHPLAEGSEAHYRFASGDSTLITLPDGRRIRLLELKLIPRRADPMLVSGSLWLEADRFAVVQGVFRLARPFDLDRDLDEDDKRDVRGIPGFLKPIKADLRYLTIDYGLWEMRWWLPRVVALEGYAEAGSLVKVPVRYELAYSEYELTVDTFPIPLRPEAFRLAGDTFPRPRCQSGQPCRCIQGVCRRVEVRLPADSSLLLVDPHLPASVYSAGPELIDDDEVRAILTRLSRSGAPPDFVGPRLFWGFERPELTRYNRVEGLSTGLRLSTEYGGLGIDLTGRVGWSDRSHPGLSLGVRWDRRGYVTRLGIYRDLVALEPATRPFGLANSLHAFFFGRDDGDYLRALGVDLSGGSGPGAATRLDWRLYAERQTPVENRTRTSLRRLWNKEDPFRPNLQADSAELVGAAVDLRVARGLDPVGVRWGTRLSLAGAVGSHRHLRGAAAVNLAGPLPGHLVGAVEAEAGTSIGEVPIQQNWFLGGTGSLRGYAPLAMIGSAYWRTRLEVGTRVPVGRLVLFSDLGWAGDRQEFPGKGYLAGAGVGVSLLDGLFRLDLARALRTPTGWRLNLATDLGL